MNPFRTMWRWLRSLGQRRAVKREIDDELRFHIEKRTAENIAAGMSPEEAARVARKRFGNLQSVREECRETRGASLGEAIWRDVRFAFRQLLRNPGFAAVAVLTLALGIGANTAIFSVVVSILIRPYPYPKPDRVVNVGMVWTKSQWGDQVQEISPPAFLEIQESARGFAAVGFIEADKKADLHINDRALRLSIAKVTPGVWASAQATPIIGRVFEEGDLASGDDSLVVLSHDLWRRQFNNDPGVVGRKIRLDDRSYEVIGVMPPGFSIAANQAKLWIPKVFSAQERSEDAWGTYAFQAIGRLREGVSLAQVRQELQALHASHLERNPGARELSELTGQSYGAASLSAWVNGRSSGSTVLAIQMAAALVLLIGCLNIAGLLVVQGQRRLREFALRSALGASCGRLARQLALETTTMFLLGGVLGALVAAVALRNLPGHFDLSRLMPYGRLVGFNVEMLAVAVGLSLVTGLATGSLPVLFALRINLGGILQAYGQSLTAGKGRRLAQSAFVVAQVALSLTLLTAAGVTVRNLRGLLGKGFGVAVEDRIVARTALPAYRYGSDLPATLEKINPFKERVLEKLRSLPGVKRATAANRAPLSADWPQKFGFEIPGYEPARGESPGICFAYQIQSDYFQTVGLPLIRGRDLASSDHAGSMPVVVISEKISRKYFPNRNPIGGRLRLFGRECEIVGVVGETQNVPLSYGNAPAVYLSAHQWPVFHDEAVFVVHTALPSEAMAPAIARVLNNLDPLLSVEVGSMAKLQQSAIVTQSAPMEIAGYFALLAVLLTAIGLYGLLASSVDQRTRELAIRMALGAQHRSIVGMVLSQGVALALSGIVLGALILVPLLRWIRPLLLEADATRLDMPIYASCLIVAITLLACWVPARRAAKIDPMEALRHE